MAAENRVVLRHSRSGFLIELFCGITDDSAEARHCGICEMAMLDLNPSKINRCAEPGCTRETSYSCIDGHDFHVCAQHLPKGWKVLEASEQIVVSRGDPETQGVIYSTNHEDPSHGQLSAEAWEMAQQLAMPSTDHILSSGQTVTAGHWTVEAIPRGLKVACVRSDGRQGWSGQVMTLRRGSIEPRTHWVLPLETYFNFREAEQEQAAPPQRAVTSVDEEIHELSKLLEQALRMDDPERCRGHLEKAFRALHRVTNAADTVAGRCRDLEGQVMQLQREALRRRVHDEPWHLEGRLPRRLDAREDICHRLDALAPRLRDRGIGHFAREVFRDHRQGGRLAYDNVNQLQQMLQRERDHWARLVAVGGGQAADREVVTAIDEILAQVIEIVWQDPTHVRTNRELAAHSAAIQGGRERPQVPGDHKPCPRCGTISYRVMGCSHVQCSSCQTRWCYTCGLARFGETSGAGAEQLCRGCPL